MSDVTAVSARQRIRDEAIQRVAAISPGDTVTNICAGAKNPHRVSKFVKPITQRTKRRGFVHNTYYAQCTDGRSKWKTSVEVIYPGKLDPDECERLYKPVWEAQFGGRETK